MVEQNCDETENRKHIAQNKRCRARINASVYTQTLSFNMQKRPMVAVMRVKVLANILNITYTVYLTASTM